MIRKAKLEDIHNIVTMEETLFSNIWNEKQWHYEIRENMFAEVYVLEIDGNIIGYLDFWITFEICQLAKIAILTKYQHRGYAKQLIEFMIVRAEEKQCERITLEVRISNSKAIHLYQTYDFIKVNQVAHYYHDGEDAFIFIKALGGELV